MFLHKRGCEYYQEAIFKIISAVKEIIRKSGDENLKADKILDEGHNSKDILMELKKHTENIMMHMKRKNKEKNVLEKFADKIEDTIGGNLTDENGLKMKFSKIVYTFEYMHNRYERLEKCIEQAIKHRTHASEIKAKELLDDYISIKTALDNIHVASKETSDNLKHIITEIKKEKEFITKEEAGLSDFQKNMMSWF
ncbi:MAG: hypothetical protein ACP5NW_00595 [Candidatus Woesearchaeota archaeon]